MIQADIEDALYPGFEPEIRCHASLVASGSRKLAFGRDGKEVHLQRLFGSVLAFIA